MLAIISTCVINNENYFLMFVSMKMFYTLRMV